MFKKKDILLAHLHLIFSVLKCLPFFSLGQIPYDIGYKSVNKVLESKYKTIVDHYIKPNLAEICIFYRTFHNKEDTFPM